MVSLGRRGVPEWACVAVVGVIIWVKEIMDIYILAQK
jgi:hypothetical protein